MLYGSVMCSLRVWLKAQMLAPTCFSGLVLVAFPVLCRSLVVNVIDIGGREDLMDRGVLEASELKIAFLSLETEKGGSVTTVQDLLKWPIIASAIKEGVVSYYRLDRLVPDGSVGWEGGRS